MGVFCPALLFRFDFFRNKILYRWEEKVRLFFFCRLIVLFEFYKQVKLDSFILISDYVENLVGQIFSVRLNHYRVRSYSFVSHLRLPPVTRYIVCFVVDTTGH